MAKDKGKKNGARGRRQGEIPGTEPPRIGEIDECALELVEVRDELKELKAKETETEERLKLLCGEHKVGESKSAPYVFIGEDGERLQCYQEIAKRRMRVKKLKAKPAEAQPAAASGDAGDFGERVH